MSEIPDKNENFESTYESALNWDGYDAGAAGFATSSLLSFSQFSEDEMFQFSTMSENDDKSLNIGNVNSDLSVSNNNGFWKYNEDKILKELKDYLGGTYRSHYTSQESKTQTLDLIESIGDAEPFCRSNAIKYLSRFGKKNGKSKMDVLKAIHYCILLYHFAGLCNENTQPYETF